MLSNPPDHPLTNLNLDAGVTSREMVESGLIAEGFFDTIKFYRQAVIDSTNPSEPPLIRLQKKLRHARLLLRSLLILSILMIPLMIVTHILVSESMEKTDKKSPISNPFVWFIPDCLLCFIVLLFIAVHSLPQWKSNSPTSTNKLVIVALSFCSILIMELVANSIHLNKLSQNPAIPPPRRADVPVKFMCSITLLLCEVMLSETMSSKYSTLTNVCLDRTASLFVILEPIMVPLTGLHCYPCKGNSSMPVDYIGVLLVIAISSFTLAPSLKADGIINLPYYVCNIPASICVVAFFIPGLNETHTSLKSFIVTTESDIVALNERIQRTRRKKVQDAISTRFNAYRVAWNKKNPDRHHLF
ncbi:hypothetical protein BLNAU_4109 [Blattamonas nauphoetae]|uniref:Uncharacterized protein n=1 Tax=Blattamonas nauphoetae TaxID=2049346 RepID=A0ABQ9YB70_9EUKA|nr:hypothetical protein BLNAU_4109 [Blattamonas nauphoetae]